jgi:Ca2+-binding RTX toxin-like protein
MAVIDFGNIGDINMQAPGALGTRLFANFAGFDFKTGGFDQATGRLTIPSTSNASAFVYAYGSWGFEPDGTPVDGSTIQGIEVWGPGGYRVVIADINVFFPTLRAALEGRNISGLYAGHALDILGRDGHDTLVGGSLDDEIWGYVGRDVLSGNAGNDYLDGGAGQDTMRGGLGNDDYFVGHARDVIIENAGEGIDLVVTTLDGYRLPANFEDLGLFGPAGAIDAIGNAAANFMAGNDSANRLQGRGGDDAITGGGGADVLSGGDGNDELEGDAGADQLRGGAGNDRLYWDASDTVVDGGDGLLDTLIVRSGNLNVPGLPDGRVIDIERISLAGAGSQFLTVTRAEVLALSSSTDTLRVLGGPTDSINVIGNFVEGGTSGGFTTYSLGGGAKLIVESEIDVV